MLLLQKPSHPYFVPLVECTVLDLPQPFGKLLQGEFSLLQADWQFAFCMAQVRRIVAFFICIIIVLGNLGHWRQVRNPGDMSVSLFRTRLESFRWEATRGSPTCAGSRSRLSSRAARCWPIDWMVFRQSWRHSRCTWGWHPLSCNLWRGEHLRPTITTLVEVISLPLWPITGISCTCASGWLRTGCHVEWRVPIKLRSASKWLL